MVLSIMLINFVVINKMISPNNYPKSNFHIVKTRKLILLIRVMYSTREVDLSGITHRDLEFKLKESCCDVNGCWR